jgi:hypothetical protein
MTKEEIIGVWVNIVWQEDFTGEHQSVYLSFSDDPVEGECDSFGVQDSEVFYYLNAHEQELLGTALAENAEAISFNDEWRIQLSHGVDWNIVTDWSQS